jgi:long-chain alkane monooxygenase
MPDRMHLGAVFMNGPSQWAVGEWALPGYPTDDWTQPELWQERARLLERGRFDVMFFADNSAPNDHFGDSRDAAVKYGITFPAHDPISMVPYLAAATTRIGLAATSTATYDHPYSTARRFGTLAHLTRGRVAWNVVASSFRSEAANFGLDAPPPHDTRYDRADEFVEICQGLWGCWEPDAVVEDRETRVWADPAKVHSIDYVGKFYSCRGPLNVVRSPFGPPVLFGAGQSDRGLDSCARHSEVVFGIQYDAAGMKAHRDRFREKVAAAGRNPDHVPIMWGVFPIVGRSEAEARELDEQVTANVPAEGGLALMSNHLGFDASPYDLDTSLASVHATTETGSQGMIKALIGTYGAEATLRDLAKIYGAGLSPHVVGTAEQVADQLEALYSGGGGDGFLLLSTGVPGALAGFVDGVVPILQDRGLFRREYTGTTLREHLLER